MIQFDEHIFQVGGEKPPTRTRKNPPAWDEQQVPHILFTLFVASLGCDLIAIVAIDHLGFMVQGMVVSLLNFLEVVTPFRFCFFQKIIRDADNILYIYTTYHKDCMAQLA